MSDWRIKDIRDSLYRAKFVDVPDIIEDWLSDNGGLAGTDVLEFGCGEGTTALAMALRKNVQRIVGVEILDVYNECLPLGRQQIGLEKLPDNLFLRKIAPGAELTQWGPFDVDYSWSVFEHVAQDKLVDALKSINAALKTGGLIFIQISPLYYSAYGSHLGPWIPEPWAHLLTQQDIYHRRLQAAPPTVEKVRREWAVYIPLEAETETERAILWEVYESLNKITGPQLCRLLTEAGFEILRDYRTKDAETPPPSLTQVFNEEAIKTQQIVLLGRKIGSPQSPL